MCTPSCTITSCTSRPSLTTAILLRCLRLRSRTSAGSRTDMIAHPVGAGVGLDDHERLLVDAVLAVLERGSASAATRRWSPGSPRPSARGNRSCRSVAKYGVISHGSRSNCLREASWPPRCTRRSGCDLRRTAQPACSGGSSICSCRSFRISGHARGQVVVEQDRARIEVVEPDAQAAPHQRLDRHRLAVGKLDPGRPDRCPGSSAAVAHVQAGLAQDRRQPLHVLQIERVARCGSRESAAGCARRGSTSRSPPSPPAPPAAASRRTGC